MSGPPFPGFEQGMREEGERAGLITQGRRAQLRPRRLQAAPLKEAVDWLERYRKFWEESFDRLEGLLQELQEKEHAGEK